MAWSVAFAMVLAASAAAAREAVNEAILVDAFVELCAKSTPNFAERIENDAINAGWTRVPNDQPSIPPDPDTGIVNEAAWTGHWQGSEIAVAYSEPPHGSDDARACSVTRRNAQPLPTATALSGKIGLESDGLPAGGEEAVSFYKATISSFGVIIMVIPVDQPVSGTTIALMLDRGFPAP